MLKKSATLLVILCICFVISGFGNKRDTNQTIAINQNQYSNKYSNKSLTEEYSKYQERTIKTTCKGNIKNIATACEIYAADHNGKYPKTLNAIVEEGYTIQYFKIVQKGMYFDHITTQAKEVPRCPIDNCEYKFISKYIEKTNNSPRIDYFIIKCPKHPLVFDSNIGIIDLENADNSTKNYYTNISNGKINLGNGKIITLTSNELRILGIK